MGSIIKTGAKLVRQVELPQNGTPLVIAKMDRVILPKDGIGSDGCIDLEKAGTITCSGLDSCHTTTQIARLAYAKPDIVPQKSGG